MGKDPVRRSLRLAVLQEQPFGEASPGVGVAEGRGAPLGMDEDYGGAFRAGQMPPVGQLFDGVPQLGEDLPPGVARADLPGQGDRVLPPCRVAAESVLEGVAREDPVYCKAVPGHARQVAGYAPDRLERGQAGGVLERVDEECGVDRVDRRLGGRRPQHPDAVRFRRVVRDQEEGGTAGGDALPPACSQEGVGCSLGVGDLDGRGRAPTQRKGAAGPGRGGPWQGDAQSGKVVEEG